MTKPVQFKALAGTIRNDRDEGKMEAILNLSPMSYVPPCPDWMPNAHAVKAWERIAPILVANKLLAETDIETFGQMCALTGKVIQLYAAGETPGASMLGILRTMQNDFGMTPAARGKVKQMAETPADNKFSKNGTRNR